MISGKVKKIMSGAILRFADREQVSATDVCMFIHSKQDDCSPQYFYTVKGAIKRNEQGGILDLDFKKDVLNVRIDLIGSEYIASTFLKGYIKNAAEEHNLNPKSIYIQIATADNNASNLHLALLHMSEKVKDLSLDDIFSD